MTNTTSIDIEKLTEQVANADPTISVGDINVQGNLDGNIVVGNRNVIKNHYINYEIHTDNGAFVNVYKARIEITKRAVDHDHPPVRRPRVFVDRKQELGSLDEYIHKGWPILLHGHSGIGKTTLVQEFAYSDAAKTLPDGVVYLEKPYEGGIPGLQDTLQRVFDKLFVTNPPVKFTDSMLEADLAETRPLLIFDEVGLPLDALNRLPALFPHAAVLVTSQDPPYDDDMYEDIQIAALGHEQAVQLFIEKSRIKVNEGEHLAIGQICKILEDVPLAVVTVANAIRQKRIPLLDSMLQTLESVVSVLKRIQPHSQGKTQAAIERSFLLFYSNTDSQAPREIELLLDVASAPGKSVDREWLENEWDGAKEAVKSLEELEVLYANSPRLRMPEGLRQTLKSLAPHLRSLGPAMPGDNLDKDLEETRQGLLNRLMNELKKPQPDPDLISSELGNILGVLQWAFNERRWNDVIRLGQAVDPYLTLHGLWDAWGDVLKQIQVAGRNIKDSKKQALIQAWTYHQLGTREIGIGSLSRAVSLLRRALMIRISQGDIYGAAYTLHNLRIILPPLNLWRRLWKKIIENIQKLRWVIPVVLVGMIILVGAFLPPSLKLTMQADPTKYHISGQVIEYGYIVDNGGLKRIPGPILVTDDKEVQIRCPDLEIIGNEDGYLDWNETINCTGYYSVNEGDIEVGSVTNTAIANAAVNVDQKLIRSKPQSVTITLESTYLALTMQTSNTTYTNSGEIIPIAYNIRNKGTTTLMGPVTVTDDRTQVKCPDLIQINDFNDFLSEGESLTCTATYTITDADVTNDFVTITAQATAGEINSDPQSIRIYRLPQSDLTFSVSADRSTYSNVGDQIIFTYIVMNSGNIPLGPDQFTVSDSLIDSTPINCGTADTTLAPDATVTCIATYTITEADLTVDSISNYATASGGGIEPSQPANTTINNSSYPPPTNEVEMTVQADTSAPINAVGQTIQYTYAIRNTGTVPLPGVVSIVGTTARCPTVDTIGNLDDFLDPSETLACVSSYTVTQEDLDRGSVTTVTTASVNGTLSNPITTTVATVPNRRLTLTKTANPLTYEQVGQSITYTYVITNSGTLDIGPAQFTVSDAGFSTPLNCGNADTTLVPNATVTCSATYTITQADMDVESISTAATASGGGMGPSQPASATVTKSLIPNPSKLLTLSVTANPSSYNQAGQVITYTYVVKNSGNAALGPAQVTISDSLISATPFNCGAADTTLAPAATVTCTETYTITEADTASGIITNNATASGGGAGPSQAVSITVNFESKLPLLTLFKSADRETYRAVGEQVTYTYNILNQGSDSIRGPIIVKDDMTDIDCPDIKPIDNQRIVLEPGQLLTCTATYKVTEADIKEGLITNTAVAYIGQASSEPQSVTIYYQAEPSSLSLKKTAEPNTYRKAGQKIRYTYFVTNDGKYPLRGPLTVKDDKTNITCPEIDTTGDRDGVLDPGELLTCISEYTITDIDIRNGSVTNVAVAGMDGVESNSDSVTIIGKVLNFKKSADHDTYNAAGEMITYTYEVTSQSGVSLAGPVLVADNKLEVSCQDVHEVGNLDELLDRSEMITCTGQYAITQADIDTIPSGGDHGSVTNTAVASVGNVFSDPTSVTITAIPERALSLEMSADPKIFDSVDQSITYTYIVTNTGNVTITSPVQITDDHIDDKNPFDCDTVNNGLSPNASVTCTSNYNIVQADFGSDSVTNTAIASSGDIKSLPVTTTISCQYPPGGWVRYIVESGETLAHISSWFDNTTEGDLRKKNCMGLSTTIIQGQPLYIPGDPPLKPSVLVTIRDSSGAPLINTPVTLINVTTGSSRTERTGGDGSYTFSNLEPGIYRIFQSESPFLRRGDRWTPNFVIVAE